MNVMNIIQKYFQHFSTQFRTGLEQERKYTIGSFKTREFRASDIMTDNVEKKLEGLERKAEQLKAHNR